MNPILYRRLLTGKSKKFPPDPPYIIAANSNQEVHFISGLSYPQGDGPSGDSTYFRVMADGLTPAIGNITVTPSSNLEIYNGTIWLNIPFTIPYTDGYIVTEMIYKVRLKSGLSINTYNETITLSGANANNFIINVTGKVTVPITIIATGGIISRNGDFLVHELLEDDFFNVIQVGNLYNTVDALIVGGAASGGEANGGGGGAAGGVKLILNHVVTIQSYPVIIGFGGLRNPGMAGNDGGDSYFDGIISNGGGGGGSTDLPRQGKSGGSGGGSIARIGPEIGGLGIVGQGNNGGAAINAGIFGSGGGGGAGTAGQDGTALAHGNGGDGILSSITGIPKYYGGGGGGGRTDDIGNETTGGLGGGGNGSTSTQGGQDGTDGLGGGGGGGGQIAPKNVAGKGGKGVVIITYYSPL